MSIYGYDHFAAFQARERMELEEATAEEMREVVTERQNEMEELQQQLNESLEELDEQSTIAAQAKAAFEEAKEKAEGAEDINGKNGE